CISRPWPFATPPPGSAVSDGAAFASSVTSTMVPGRTKRAGQGGARPHRGGESGSPAAVAVAAAGHRRVPIGEGAVRVRLVQPVVPLVEAIGLDAVAVPGVDVLHRDAEDLRGRLRLRLHADPLERHEL